MATENKIKVWVAVDLRDVPQAMGLAEQDARVQACRRFNTSWGDLTQFGWTVQPYTLVKGHDHE